MENKLVVAVASSALFDLTESDRIYREQGKDAYREFQRAREHETLLRGVAFPFVKRLLALNEPGAEPAVEVILLSRNDADTGLRVMNSIEKHRLGISRAAFVAGETPWKYIAAFGASLFLSANERDVREAIVAGHPAGLVLESVLNSDDKDE
ncbi:MAG: 5'-nucleotidase, partial [Gaiellaceae bacterium]